MRKLKFYIAAAVVAACLCVSVPGVQVSADAATKEYYIGGMTAGFTLSAGGAEVIGLNEVSAEDGLHRPAEEAGIRIGDCICAVDGISIKTISDLNSALDKCGGKAVILRVKRGGDMAEVSVTPVQEKKSGKYKIGVLIRDSLAGIGTVTYIEKDTLRFGALGHSVCDENHNILEISNPSVYLCSVVGVNKGTRGKAGELRGLFMGDQLGKAEKVCAEGLYGTFSKSYDFSHLEMVEAAPISEATIGKAIIYSTIDGVCPQQYEIAIAKVDPNNRDNKNFVIKVTDERLISETGGIVQGMSGSPILQNGKLIGAVTHVFLNDPTRGYGIGIENMTKN
ncbi:MAG: PDZ domain-containing protein [Clostridia bacterium]|nr:PDZ domain-containing protein [Clostridia bacterium]